MDDEPMDNATANTLHLNRRRFLAAAATTVAAGSLGILGTSRRSHAMTEATKGVPPPTATDNTAIRPFQLGFADADLADLLRRIKATRWPDRELVPDATQGVQ